ncbi:carotenoid oxygenase family protein [Spongiactinospora sp. TRM90649]|uniref:carotenoid oxygenase family protein n=1 Tax=Spongiactinospora sp. TRM90649 TaxID=3031114 RepID=UPI0023F8E6E4|nr:carotenoid oxygenase family protein [Spongiactinospora sp. TRM90649]MDF5752099.1 carotenoid oxygenase family protein [Spongiactinospora sp. TRM90649]
MGNRYLEGAFAPVTEEITAFDLPVTGRVPDDLDGRYLRNGPNPLNLEDPEAHHWMMGEGMVHGVRLRDGRAEWYRNRWVRSAEVAGRLGEPHPAGLAAVAADFAANTHVFAHAGRTLAAIEGGPPPYELDEELRTLGTCDFGGGLGTGPGTGLGEGVFTAHTKRDPVNGELHAITYHPLWDHVRHLVVDRSGTLVRAGRIPVDGAPMMHDFALTERHVVLIDQPVTFSMEAAAAGQQVPYVWNEGRGTAVGVMPREGGATRWFGTDPCYVAHTLNAYDDGEQVILDVVRYPRMDVARHIAEPMTLERWTIDPVAGTVARRVVDDRPQEFPRVGDGVVSRPHRYGYTAVTGELNDVVLAPVDGPLPDIAFDNAIIKHDYATGGSELHRFGGDAATGEAVFAARPGGVTEDDGYVLAYTHNPGRGAADLVVLSAQDFTGEPLARIHLPGRVPLGFHGSWIATGA